MIPPSSAANNKNIDIVPRIIEIESHVPNYEIRTSLSMGMKQIQSILYKHLGIKKMCSRWITHNLTEAHKTERVTCCNAMLTRFKEGALNSVWNIVTGDEKWIYCYDPKTKQQSTVWVYGDESKPTKVTGERTALSG
ncbi:Mariner Mos1 transposase [Eumeta japonica]|uniref:Mariner Mos1 transposase n=1 Tax=Eumeta variegata TaxID=151549 RepID=A0A4C2A865_EUMVA|nr:Mariner Mos1 transposase [Eumeta japonica]